MIAKGWIGLLLGSSNPNNRELGLRIKERQESEYRADLERLWQSPAYAADRQAGRRPWWKK
jgi:hypothetical protein